MKCESCEHENIEGARFCAKCGAAIHVAILGQDDPLIGQVVAGRFHITSVLGEGGMGVVYVGEQQMGTTVRKVAVKTLHSHLSKDVSIQARFNREVGTVAQLEHPNTIKVYDFGTTKDGQLYIAMEFVAGKSLADTLVNAGSLTADRTIHIMRQICGALDEAHTQGIIHRDLKPDNIILTDRAGETDFVKVLDFGIAARTESADAQKEQKLTQQGMVLGTPPYMSPEQFTGKPLDARSDVYSLGVMAYEMLTGKLPFDAETPWEWATQHMTAAPKPFEIVAPTANIPDGLRQAILRALSKDRTQRQDSARLFFAELSGGGKMTVEVRPVAAAAAPGLAYQATAAMPATPAAGAGLGYAPTALQPQMQLPVGPAMAAPVTAPAVVASAIAASPAAAAARSGGSNKGLIFGLGGLGLALVLAIVIVVVRNHKPDDVGPITATLGGPSSSGPTVLPSDPPTTINVPAATGGVAQADPVTAPHNAGHATGSVVKPHTATVGGATSTTVTATQTNTTTGTPNPPTNPPPQPPAAGASDPCAKCIAAATAGNYAGAQTFYGSCTDAAQKAACTGAVRRGAAAAARAAAMNQQCPAAKAIIAAATAMGATSPKLNSALAGSSCTP